jgi:hypothetical protein
LGRGKEDPREKAKICKRSSNEGHRTGLRMRRKREEMGEI